MKKAAFPILGALVALAGLGWIPGPAPAVAQTAPVVEDSYEVLTRGPVHEAFAESVSFEPDPGIVVAVAPPEPIEELPPEVQPEGDNVEWVPGYWGWDDDRDDYLWISGVWRDLPPGRQWVPGYWNTLATGEWQWVSGYWADASVEEVSYISTAPPQTIEVGPSVAAPTTDHSWIPGVWIYVNTRYVWRPGYWSPLRTNWTWVPARYCWTPRGYVFIDGYWDHSVSRRGVLFAPVHFRRNVWSSPGYHYRPSIVVGLDVFTDHLFYRPRTCHYYFGDYYEPRYRAAGYNAAYAWHSRRGCYDPIYAYQRWSHRGDNRWESRHRERYDYYTNHVDARPPRTWAAMRQIAPARDAAASERVFASTLGDFRRKQADNLRFREVNNDRLKQIVAQRQQTRQFSQQRKQLESRPVAPRGGGQERIEALKERMANSPIAGRPASRLEGSRRPPERIEPNAARLQQDAMERMKKAGTARTAPGRAEGGSGSTAAERLQALRDKQKQQQEQMRERSGRPTGRTNSNAEAARQAQQERLREAQEKARAAQQSRKEQMERGRAQQPQPQRSGGDAQQRVREAQEKARAQQQQRAREAQERSRAQQQKNMREAQERARAQQQQRARELQERSRQQQQERARQSQERARSQQQERARAAQQQQQQRLKEAQDRARQQQQERGRGGGNPRSRGGR